MKSGFHYNRKQQAIKRGLQQLKEQKLKMAINQIKRELVAKGQPVPSPKRLRQIAEANISINARKK